VGGEDLPGGGEVTADVDVFAEHWGAMVRSARGVLGCAEDSEDCAGQALGQVCAQDTRDVANMEAYLVTIAKRRAIDSLRQADRARRLTARVANLSSDSSICPDIADAVARRDEARWITEEARRRLRPDVFALLRRVADGDQVHSVAADLGMSEPAARAHLNRARKLLRGVYRSAMAGLGLSWLATRRATPALVPATVAVAILASPWATPSEGPRSARLPQGTLSVPERTEISTPGSRSELARPPSLAVTPLTPSQPGGAVRKPEVRGELATLDPPGATRVSVEERSGGQEGGNVVDDVVHCLTTVTVSSSHVGC
jgi:DNA-directed RNA polymerase specialized sigma24 family protein